MKGMFINGEETIRTVFMDKPPDEFIVWFFGKHHELLQGNASSELDRCSHRIFTSEKEYKKIIKSSLKQKGWSQLKNVS